MILSHFSEKDFKFNINKEYKIDNSRKELQFFKPHGLWLSDELSDCGWKAWCKGEEVGLDRLKNEAKFKLNIDNILLLNTVKNVKEFTRKYGVSMAEALGIDVPTFAEETLNSFFINWCKVKSDYSGIVLTPFFWELRLDFDVHWYYYWDCASACIWDLSTLKEIKNE